MIPLKPRLAGWYFVTLGAFGAFHPFFAVVLKDAGASESGVAAILAAFPIGLLLAGPLWAWIADSSGRAGLVLRVSAVLAAAGAWALLLAPGWRWMALCALAIALVRAPLFPLVDVLVVRSLDADGDYGPIRLWGSVGFVVAVLAVGRLLEDLPRAPLLAGAALMAVGAAIAFTLPTSGPTTREPLGPAIKGLLLHRGLWPLWLVALLHAMTIATYDQLFGLHMQSLGLPSRITGFAIAVGVLAEIALMAAAPRLLERFPPGLWILAGVASGIPRWLVVGSSQDPALLIGVQALHCLGYGAWWIGSLTLIARRAPEELRNSAQSLLVAVGYGLGNLLAMGGASLALRSGATDRLFLSLVGLSSLALLPAWLLNQRGRGREPLRPPTQTSSSFRFTPERNIHRRSI